jgi:hypothetical protein
MVLSARPCLCIIGGLSMQKKICSIVIVVLSMVLCSGAVVAQGTPVMLGAGQELRIDLPLQPGRSYEISMDVRTELPDAAAVMTLCLIGENNQVLETWEAKTVLPETGEWAILGFSHVPLPQKSGRWELVVTADQEGRYYWQNLRVLRSYNESQETIAYWNDKLSSQGEFYTGLVVDARHLDVRRGISPRIYSENGQLIYGGVLASQDLVQERGVVGYGSELTPELLQRLEVDPDYPYAKPLVVEAIGVADAAQTGVYISNEDTQRVLEAMAQYDFFARYAVIFLIN